MIRKKVNRSLCRTGVDPAHPFCAAGFDVGDGDAVDAGGTLVGGHVDPCPPHHVAAGELVVEGVEPTLWLLLGTAVEHALEGLKFGDAFELGHRLGPCAGVAVPSFVGAVRLI